MTQYEKGLVDKLNQLIEEKYINSESITDDLCHELGISRSNLYRILKDNFQLSPSLYIRKIKLKKAKSLLKNTDMKISEIAYFIGIDSPQNFTKYFTQEHGVNPTEFRKKKLEAKIEIPETPVEIKPLPLIKPKTQLKERFSFFLPGIVVFILTAFGFYFWQKKYLNETDSQTKNIRQSIALMPFNCENFVEKKSCDTISNLFLEIMSKSDKIELLEKSVFENISEKTVDQLNVIYLLKGGIMKKGEDIYLKIDVLDAKVEKLVFSKSLKMFTLKYKELISQIVNEISQEIVKNSTEPIKGKFYLLPTKNMITYRQYLQGSQLVFDWSTRP